MRISVVVALLTVVTTAKSQDITGPAGEVFSMRVLAEGLHDPWQLRLDEKKHVWFTESRALRVIRINIATRQQTVLLDLRDQVNYKRFDTIDDAVDGGKPWPAGGLMGLALHPEISSGQPYVFLNYIHSFEGAGSKGKGCRDGRKGCYFRAKLVRYRYDASRQKLVDPVVLCDSIPASNDHNGSRLLIAPVNGKNFLFYAIGDMGAGQFDNAARKNHAQNPHSYEGKILRFNIDPDAQQKGLDKWIPDDNPFNTERQNAVWSYGHRNPQGLFYALINNNGILYSSEHGPYSDDEINIIQSGKNYGHPLIIGFADGNYDGLAAGVTSDSALPGEWNSAYPKITSEQQQASQLGENFRPPLFSLYPTERDSLRTKYERLRKNDKQKVEWLSEAPSSIAVYTHDSIPGWKNSILLPCLKTGRVLRIRLAQDGLDVTGDTMAYFSGSMRYRDIAIADDGRTLYVAVDASAVTSGPSEKQNDQMAYRGAILAFRFERMTN